MVPLYNRAYRRGGRHSGCGFTDWVQESLVTKSGVTPGRLLPSGMLSGRPGNRKEWFLWVWKRSTGCVSKLVLAFANYEFCPETDPFEAGIGFAVSAAKLEDYSGREALVSRRENPRKCLVGLESQMNDRLDHGDPVYSGRARIGVVTSACNSPVLGKSIALARVDVSMAEIGQKLEIGKLDGFQKRISVSVTSFPAYDPKKTRVRS